MRPVLLLLLAPACSAAQASRFELAASTPTALIGAPFELEGSAVFPDRYTLDAAPKDQKADPFEILSIEAGAPAKKDGMATVPVRIRVAAFGLGDVVFPSLRWALRGGAETGVMESPPVRVKVLGPQPGKNADIRDIVGPIPVRVWPWFLAAALLATAALAAVLRRRPAAPGAAAAAPSPDDRTPDEIAIAELRSLAASDLPVKEYYDRLSDILRLYFDRRFQVPALNMTTLDLQRRIVREGLLDSRARNQTKSLLDRCDLAKFARFLPARQEGAKDCETAIEIVKATTPPRPAPAAQAPAGSGVKG